MKRFIIFISLIPQLLFAQYQSREFMLLNERNTTGQALGITTTKDSIVALNIGQPVSGLFISGVTILDNMQDSYAKVIVKDRYNAEYLVYENYPLLSDSCYSRFSKVAIESVLLDDIVPTSIKIEVSNASIQIDSIYFPIAQNLKQGFRPRMRSIRQEQTLFLADRLNEHIRERHLPWYAGCTSVALMNYEEKKEMFGSKMPCLYGFDFYKGGVFVIDPDQLNVIGEEHSTLRSSPYVNDFDWRNRHGKNWITSVKQQQGNTCWDFASVATVESNFNIYFNQVFEDTVTNNLSEQELVSCLDNDNSTIYNRLYHSGYAMYALDYIRRKGIVREECFRWMGEIPCDDNYKCSNPNEIISFNSFRNICHNLLGYSYVYTDNIADSLKKAIIKSPVVVDYFIGAGMGHSFSCVGFHQIQMGDTLCENAIKNPAILFVVDSTTSNYIDKTSWIIKNSYGEGWGEQGFARVIFDNTRLRLYETIPPFTSLIYSNNDRCVTDEDMDGYYTWGSGSKPSNLPVWIPDEQDGDDTNPIVGPIDEYGNCDTLTVTPSVTWYIDSIVYHSVSDNFTYPNIVILQGGTLTIDSSTILMKSNATIRVQSGGKLIIDGGQLLDTDIVIENGGTLIIDNGGLVQTRHNGQILTRIGSKMFINNGKIEKGT